MNNILCASTSSANCAISILQNIEKGSLHKRVTVCVENERSSLNDGQCDSNIPLSNVCLPADEKLPLHVLVYKKLLAVRYLVLKEENRKIHVFTECSIQFKTFCTNWQQAAFIQELLRTMAFFFFSV